MIFDLEEKYEQSEDKKLRSIVASLITTLMQFVIVIIVLGITLLLLVLVPKFWFIGLILLVLGVCANGSVISNSIIRRNVANLKTYKIALIVEYLLFLSPAVLFLVLTVGANYREHMLPTEYNLNFKTNLKDFMFTIKDGVPIGSFNIPTIIVLVIILFVSFLVFAQIVMLDYDNTAYIASDDLVYPAEFAFTLVGEDDGENVIDYDYLKTLSIDDSDYIEADNRYFNFYLYGEDDKYFHIEAYKVYEKKNKIKKSKNVISDKYKYDIESFT